MKKAAKAGKGRPRKKYGRREIPVSVKLTVEEKAKFEKAADSQKMSLSDWVRDVLHQRATQVLGE